MTNSGKRYADYEYVVLIFLVNLITQQEIIQTQPIQRNKRYYSFDITEFMSSRLQQNITKPNLVNVSFQVTSNQERDMDRIFSFNGLFDVQVNLPIVVYLFNGFVPSENLGYK